MDQERILQLEAMIMQFMNEPTYRPMKLKEMAIVLQVTKEKKEDLRFILDKLVREGRINISSKGKYGLFAATYLKGTFIGNAKGFGFVTIQEREDDIFIAEKNTLSALNGDIVLVEIIVGKSTKRRSEGVIRKIIEHNTTQIVGRYEKQKGYGFIIPDIKKVGSDLYIPSGKDKGAVSGSKVVAKIINYGNETNKPEGEIVEILGHINDPGVDVLSIIRARELPLKFPKEVLEEVENIPSVVYQEQKEGRRDITDVFTVTIDGEDAKDLDDAITIHKTDEGYYLGVHIADVSEYVKENSSLDQEAYNRGTSVYLLDRVIPMLPHKLSNGICSLNANEERLALSCFMEINQNGEVISHSIEETIIRVDMRTSYTQIANIIDDKEKDEPTTLIEMTKLMQECALLLREKRFKRGSIDFDFPEAKIVLDENGEVSDIVVVERNDAHRMIEEFMLLANETVAEEYFWREVPFLYRNHENPAYEKMQALAIFLGSFGHVLRIKNEEVHPKQLQQIMSNIIGTGEEAMLMRVILRSMKQARYTPTCIGHFGLAAPYYTHFTSPIRRYPDLQIHRIIKDSIHNDLTKKKIKHYETLLPGVGIYTSQTERRAEEAERDVEKVKKAHYMARFIGEEFEGVISGVTNFGIYIELPNTTEGFVRISALMDDHYTFEEGAYQLVGENFGRIYKLGQIVRIKVDSVDQIYAEVNFSLVTDQKNGVENGKRKH